MRRVNAIWAAEHEAAAAAHDPGPTLEDRLREAGFGVDDVSAVEEVLEAEAEERAVERACTFLRRLRCALEHEHAAAGALAICLGSEKTGAEIAEGLGVSRQALHAVLGRLRAAVGDFRPGPVKATFRRPIEPGEWLCGPEARVRFGVTSDKLRRLKVRAVRAGSVNCRSKRVGEGAVFGSVPCAKLARPKSDRYLHSAALNGLRDVATARARVRELRSGWSFRKGMG